MLPDGLRVSPFDQAAIFRATSFFTLPLAQDNLEMLCSDIANAVVREFGKIDCGVMLLDQDRYHVMRVARAGGYVVSARHPIVLDGPGLIAECLRSGQTVYAPDVRLHPIYMVGDERTASELVIPLQAQGDILGVLDLQSPLYNAFGPQDRSILELFAERAAATLFNVLYAHSLEQQVYEQTRALAEAQEQVESVFSHSSDALALLDAEGRIIRVNPAFDALFGVRADGWAGLRIAQLIHEPDHDRWVRAQRSLYQQRQVRLEILLTGKGRAIFTGDVALSLMGQGQAGILCSVRDITPRKQMELELRRALEKSHELTELKSRFITTASHEFRTPLSVILASTELLYFYGNRMTSEQRTDHLMQIKQGVEGITTLLDNVLQVNASAGGDTGDFKPATMRLHPLLDSLLDTLRGGLAHQHHLQVHYTGEDGRVVADSDQLRSMLWQVLHNAIKFSPAGSQILIRVRMSPLYTVIRIRDFGIGIAPVDLPHVFETFYKGSTSGDVPGAGLGLTIVKQSVDLHRGKIKIRSMFRSGTTVSILLPGQLG